MTRKQLGASIGALVGALILTSAATAAGEAKNIAPFTTVVPHAVVQTVSSKTISGEPKNQFPFTRNIERQAVAPDWFERYAAAHPYGAGLGTTAGQLETVRLPASQTFRWSAAGLGAAATAAAMLVLLGALTLLRSRRRDHVPHAIGS